MTGILQKWMMKLLGMPSCEEVVEFLYAYLEASLDLETRKKFERHILGCARCARFLRSYRQAAEPRQFLTETPMDPALKQRVIEFLRQNS